MLRKEITGYLFFAQLFLEKQAELRQLFSFMPFLFMFMVPAVTMRLLGPLDRGPAIGGYIGLLLMGGAFVAIGVMCSAFTRNSIIAFISAFGVCFALYLFGRLTQFMPPAIQPLVSFLSIDGHFDNVSRGVIDSRDVIYYLSVIVTCLLLATTALESRRWK